MCEPRFDATRFVGLGNSILFGFKVRGRDVPGLVVKKLAERNQWESLDEPIPCYPDQTSEEWTRGSQLPDEHALLDEELDAHRLQWDQHSAQHDAVLRATRFMSSVITEAEHVVERETFVRLLAYAQACADRDEPAILDSVAIERVFRDGHRERVDEVRIGRCLEHGSMGTELPNHPAGDVCLVPKQNWKTAKKLKAFLHEQPDTTIKWTSATPAAIHKRLDRAIRKLRVHGLVTEWCFHEEDV
ncbi:MAG: hypothetical protein MRJ68_16125 [Nitrospira sp.]|nr:hypothetical protein [Nitrospira sp.]